MAQLSFQVHPSPLHVSTITHKHVKAFMLQYKHYYISSCDLLWPSNRRFDARKAFTCPKSSVEAVSGAVTALAVMGGAVGTLASIATGDAGCTGEVVSVSNITETQSMPRVRKARFTSNGLEPTLMSSGKSITLVVPSRSTRVILRLLSSPPLSFSPPIPSEVRGFRGVELNDKDAVLDRSSALGSSCASEANG
jgi:hypothetical protein